MGRSSSAVLSPLAGITDSNGQVHEKYVKGYSTTIGKVEHVCHLTPPDRVKELISEQGRDISLYSVSNFVAGAGLQYLRKLQGQGAYVPNPKVPWEDCFGIISLKRMKS